MRLIRESMRGSNRRVIVVDSRESGECTESLIRRGLSECSVQKAFSASSESKSGTSLQVEMFFMGII